MSAVLAISPSWKDVFASLLERQEFSKQRLAVPVETATKGLNLIILLQHMQKAAETDPVLKELIIPYSTLDTNLLHEHNIKSPPPQRAGKCIYAARAARLAGLPRDDPTQIPQLNVCPVMHREPAGESLPATPTTTKYKTQDMMLRAVSNAHSGFLADQPSQVVFSHLLAQLLQVTDCEYGFVGDKLYGEDGKPFLKTRALTNISWNSETREFYEANVDSGFEFKNLQSLFGYTLVTDEPVIANNPKADSRSCGGVPVGHPPMNSYLGLPLRSGKQVIGMVGLANRPGGFDEEIVKFLEPMLSACTNLIDAYNTKRLREQVKSEIMEANQRLEENVRQRTQELTLKNEALENEVEFRKQIEIELKMAKEEADRSSEAKGIFLSTMSHELRTPLNGVIGMVEVLMDTSLNDEQKEIATTISRSAITLHYLINNILDVSKLEAGKLEFAKARMSVRECLEESTYMVAVLAHQKDLDLVIDIDPDVPYTIMGDTGKLKQIIVNLVHNAVKFTEHGSVTLSCKALADVSNNTVLHVAVTDTGIGISGNNLRNLFQMFAQADQSVSQRYGGSGLGLYLTKQLIHFMGGNMTVESVEGKGSCFSFTLPVEIDASAGPPPAPVLKHAGVPLRFGFSGLRSGTLHVLQRYLTQWGGEIAFTDCTNTDLQPVPELDFVFFGPPSVVEKSVGNAACIDRVRTIEQRAKNVVLIRSIASLKPHPFSAYLPNAGYLMEPLRPSAILQFIQNHVHGIDSTGSKETLAAPTVTCEGSPKPGTELRRSTEPVTGLKVLLVDDNIVNCQVGQRLVKRLAHECRIATSGPEAIQKFNEEHWDVIFMDLVMPDMDGFKTTLLIREAEVILQRPQRTPIIALTAAGITREELLTQGFDDLASKPITGNELRAVFGAHFKA